MGFSDHSLNFFIDFSLKFTRYNYCVSIHIDFILSSITKTKLRSVSASPSRIRLATSYIYCINSFDCWITHYKRLTIMVEVVTY